LLKRPALQLGFGKALAGDSDFAPLAGHDLLQDIAHHPRLSHRRRYGYDTEMTDPDRPIEPLPPTAIDSPGGAIIPSGHAGEPPPWTGRDILVALILVYVIWPGLSFQLLTLTGLVRTPHTPTVASERPAEETSRPPEDSEGETTKDSKNAPDKDILKIRANLWAHVLAFPLQAATVPVVFYVLSGVSAARIGLTRRQLGRNLLSGLGAWLIITPLVFGINVLVAYLTRLLDPGSVQEHPLTRLATGGATPMEWVLLVFSAIVIAPVLEETVFRGVLQPWFAGFPNGGAAAMAAAFLVTVTMRQAQLVEAFRQGGAGLLTAVMPGLFVLALVPFFLFVARHPPRPESPAVFGTALLFASVHAEVWPTPVPLFVLGLALGMLAVRTGSLVGPMVLHGLFNSVTCVLLLAGWVTG
jgi:membrane protease YdiL (CAAX protease family)